MSTKKNKTSIPLEAVSFAAQAHDGQMRKDEQTPYIAHPVRVMTILANDFGVTDEEVLAAGVLHDTVEDTDAEVEDIEQLFGKNVAEYVDILSKDTELDRSIREYKYARELANAPVKVKLCKLADLYDNISDMRALTDEKARHTVQRAERLFILMTDGFPPQWQNAVDLVGKKINHLKNKLKIKMLEPS